MCSHGNSAFPGNRLEKAEERDQLRLCRARRRMENAVLPSRPDAGLPPALSHGSLPASLGHRDAPRHRRS